jgi:hypothetical protein
MTAAPLTPDVLTRRRQGACGNLPPLPPAPPISPGRRSAGVWKAATPLPPSRHPPTPLGKRFAFPTARRPRRRVVSLFRSRKSYTSRHNPWLGVALFPSVALAHFPAVASSWRGLRIAWRCLRVRGRCLLVSAFSARIGELLDDEEQRALQLELVQRPTAGSVIPGTGGLRNCLLEERTR